MKRYTAAAVVLLLLGTGCSRGDNSRQDDSLRAWSEEDQATITVMYYDESAFFTEYGNLFYSKYPNIDIEVLSTQGIYKPGEDYLTQYRKFVSEKQPDVIMSSTGVFESLAADGQFLDLDLLVNRDGFQVDQYYPGMLDALRTMGGGKLYGLAPRFSSTALYYNKDLFEQHGIAPPEDGMSWKDVFELAKRFPAGGTDKERIYGFSTDSHQNGVFYFGQSLASTYGLNFMDFGQKKITIQTKLWEEVFGLAIDALQSGALNSRKDPAAPAAPVMYEDYLMQNLFVAGRSAMTVDHSYLMTNLNQAKNRLTGTPAVNWEIVTAPVDPAAPDISRSVNWNQLFSVRAGSANASAAWELVKYINGEDYAKVMSRSQPTNGLLSRISYNKDKEGRNLEPFYKLKAKIETMDTASVYKIPDSFYQTFVNLANQELDLVMDGKKSLSEALGAIQAQGQAQLDAAAEQAPQPSASP
ncbi:MAG: extracellular solute-binding protein [Paenibacillaceae bacterium]|nr:extracellular solute-binding protein [Paenibacillaceae bacterium]